jgi:hypothetical protein
MYGGADRDTFGGSQGPITVGDVIVGGETGNDTNDTIDLTDAAPVGGSVSVVYDAADPEAGIISFLDAANNLLGTATFSEIENITGLTTTPVTFYDAIELGTGVSSTAGATMTTVSGDLASIQEPVVFNAATPGNIQLGDTTTIGGVTYSITSLYGVDADFNLAGGGSATNVSAHNIELTEVGGGGAVINYLIPVNSTNYVDITSIDVNTTAAPVGPGDLVQASLYNTDDTVTLAPAATVTIYDAIEVNAAVVPGTGVVLTTANGDLVEVDEPLTFNVGTPGEIGIGDTVNIGGTVWTVLETAKHRGDIDYNNGAGPVTSTVDGYGLILSDGGGNTLTYLLPDDSHGNLEDITQIALTNYAAGGIGPVPVSGMDDDDIVTLKADDEIFDLIQLSGGTPGAGDVLTTAGGDLVSVQEPVSFDTQAVSGQISVGDTVTIGGTGYTVTGLHSTYTYVTHMEADGTEQVSAVDAVGITFTPGGGGAALEYMMPVDAEGNLPDITRIQVVTVNPDPATIAMSEVDTNDMVTLTTGSPDAPVYDLIEVCSGTPGVGDVITTASGDLHQVVEPVQFSTAVNGQISAGDTTTIDGVTYTVTSVANVDATYQVTNQLPGPVVNVPGVTTQLITLQDAGGNTVDFLAPVDPEGTLSGIKQVTIDSVTGTGSVPISSMDGDNDVTLWADGAVYDMIQVADGITIAGGGMGLTTSENELVSVHEPVVINGATAGVIAVGDTATVCGVNYTVTAVQTGTGEITHSDGAGGTVYNDPASIHNITLTEVGGGGATLNYLVPVDPGGDFVDITHININTMNAVASVTEASVDGDDLVTLAENDVIYDVIRLNPGGAISVGDNLDTASGELVSVNEPMEFSVATPGVIADGDLITIGGVSFEVTNVEGMYGSYNLSGGGTVLARGYHVTTEDPGGNVVEYLIPSDNYGNMPDITSVDITSIQIGQDQVIIDHVDDNDIVTLAAAPGTHTVYDLIELDAGIPTTGNTLTTAGGDLVQIEEPMVFTTATVGTITIGDTTTIGATTYTVIDVTAFKNTYTHSGGASPQITKGYAFTLDDGFGNTISYLAPWDANNNMPDITQIVIGSEDASVTDMIVADLDQDQTVTLICFAGGTRIMTTAGELKVEDLEIGQMVQTMDHGLQPIRWIGRRKVAAKGDFAPVVIRKGALGNTGDLRVSPQHRMLISGWRSEMLFDESQVLAAAKHLTNGDTIYVEEGGEVEYFHIMFDQHEVIFAEGAPSESFHPGEMGLNSIESAQRDELLKLFPELEENTSSYGASARVTLLSYEAKLLADVA